MNKYILWIIVVAAAFWYGGLNVTDFFNQNLEPVRELPTFERLNEDVKKIAPSNFFPWLDDKIGRAFESVADDKESQLELPELPPVYRRFENLPESEIPATLGFTSLNIEEEAYVNLALDNVYRILRSPAWQATVRPPVALKFSSQRILPGSIPTNQLALYYIQEMSQKLTLERTLFGKSRAFPPGRLAQNLSYWTLLNNAYSSTLLPDRVEIVFSEGYLQHSLARYRNGNRVQQKAALAEFIETTMHELGHSYGHLHPDALPDANNPDYFINWVSREVQEGFLDSF